MSSGMALMPASHRELYCACKSALATFGYSLAPSARSHNLGTHFFDNIPRTNKSGNGENRMVSLLHLVMLFWTKHRFSCQWYV